MSQAERLSMAEQRAALAEKERDMWRARAEELETKLNNLKKRTSEAATSEPKKAASAAASGKCCSACGKPKSECKSPVCKDLIASKKAK